MQKGRAVRKDGKKLKVLRGMIIVALALFDLYLAFSAKVGDKVLHTDILLEGEELDRAFPVAIMLHKQVGYVVTAPDDEKILDPKVYDLLPFRYGHRASSRLMHLHLHLSLSIVNLVMLSIYTLYLIGKKPLRTPIMGFSEGFKREHLVIFSVRCVICVCVIFLLLK